MLKEIYVDACESVRVFFPPVLSLVGDERQGKQREKGDGGSRSCWTPGAVGRSVTGRGGLCRERGGRRRHVYTSSHISLVLTARRFLCSFGEAKVDGAPTTRHGACMSLPPGPLFRESDRSTLLFYFMITCILRGLTSSMFHASCVYMYGRVPPRSIRSSTPGHCGSTTRAGGRSRRRGARRSDKSTPLGRSRTFGGTSPSTLILKRPLTCGTHVPWPGAVR